MRVSGTARLATIWLVGATLLSLFAPVLSNGNPFTPVGEPLLPPGANLVLGTDALGRDQWTRIAYGARFSLGTSLTATVITVFAGMLIGLTAASFGGWFDRVVLLSVNAALSIPGILFAMLLVAGMGPGILTVLLAVGIGGIPGFGRLARTVFLQEMEMGYVEAAVSLGAGRGRIAFFHLLPNARGKLLSFATTHFAWAFMGATTLTFLGMAGDPSLPEWGAMLNTGRAYLFEAPWLAFYPGVLISLTILAVHKLGDQLAART